MIRSVLILLSVFVIYSCSEKNGGQITISGQYGEAEENDKLYLELFSPFESKLVDSVIVDKEGNFSMKIEISEPAMYRLILKNGQTVNMILNDTDVKIVKKENDTPVPYVAEGSRDTDFMTKLVARKKEMGVEVEKINQQYMNANMDGDQELMNKIRNDYGQIHTTYVKQLKEDIWKMDHSIAGIIGLQFIKQKEPEIDFMDSLATKYQKQLPNSMYTKNLVERVNSLKKLAIGSPAPEIELPDVNGGKIKLSSLKGKYVLIDFWASWCRPCREENPNVLKIYNEYKDQGFEIYGVSLDQKKEPWIQAIKTDNITWLQVLDNESEAAQVYQVLSIPSTYLIDPDGNIAAKNLRGPLLKDKLQEIFG